MVKSISVLGCTGSIGRQTIAVAGAHRHEGCRPSPPTGEIDMLEEQARRLHPGFCGGATTRRRQGGSE